MTTADKRSHRPENLLTKALPLQTWSRGDGADQYRSAYTGGTAGGTTGNGTKVQLWAGQVRPRG